MFPLRYYGTHYWPTRYFPKVGATPPDIIRILINGVNKTDAMWYGASNQWNVMRGSRGTCALAFVVEPGDIWMPNMGEPIQIYDPKTECVWRGHIDKIGMKWLGDKGWRVYIVSGTSLESLFDTVELDKVKYTGVTCAEAFDDVFTLAAVTDVGLGTLTGATNVEALEVTNAAAGFSTLALYCGAIWYIDPLDGNIYMHPTAARAADWSVASEDILWDTIEWTQNRSDVRDNQVLQLPGVSLAPLTATFIGDDVVTAFNIPTVPQYIISVDLSIGLTGRTVLWTPGTAVVNITPAPPLDTIVTVRYADSGVVTAAAGSSGVGTKTARYNKTRTFTPAGGLQEVTAITARYSMLPAQLSFSTDRPGIRIGRLLTIDLEFPLEAEILNGRWQVQEVSGMIVPGLDQRDEPYGHFRYTVKLVNLAATAVFQGDGTTTIFDLPVVPDEVVAFRTNAGGRVGTWTPATTFFEILPALGNGDSAAVDYIDNLNAPDVPTFIDTWEDMADQGQDTPVTLGETPPPSTGGDEDVFLRTLDLYDLTVGDDIAMHTTVYADGTAFRILAVLRKAITADLEVRINKGVLGDMQELITVTIPTGTSVNDVLEWALLTGSPPILGPFIDKEVLTADILASDGSSDQNGVAQFTIEWTKN